MRRNYSVHSTHRPTVGRFDLSDNHVGICLLAATIEALVINTSIRDRARIASSHAQGEM
jgi:hypothetical protein